MIILLYRHWFVLFLKLLTFFILAILPFALYSFLGNLIISAGLAEVFGFIVSLYFLFWWLGIFYQITMYLLDTWIVTDHRLLDNEQHGFFNRTLSEMHLVKVQDVSVKIQGFIPTLLSYGNLEVQTAGAEPKFVLKQIPRPNQVRAIITEASNEYLKTHKDGIEIHERQSGV